MRVFVDEGPGAARLLGAARRSTARGPVRRAAARRVRRRRPRARPADQRLVDPLSDREREVLRLLASDLSGPAIAARARRLAQHRADPHQEHLRQARRRPAAAPPSPGPPSCGCCSPRGERRRPPPSSPDVVRSRPPSAPSVPPWTPHRPAARTSPAGTRSASTGASTPGGRPASRAHPDHRRRRHPARGPPSPTRPRCTGCSGSCATSACRWTRSSGPSPRTRLVRPPPQHPRPQEPDMTLTATSTPPPVTTRPPTRPAPTRGPPASSTC